MRGAQVPGVGLAALCAAAARMRGAARSLSEGAAAGLDDAGFFISLLHACLAHLPSWLQGAAGDVEAAAKEALSQVQRCPLYRQCRPCRAHIQLVIAYASQSSMHFELVCSFGCIATEVLLSSGLRCEP